MTPLVTRAIVTYTRFVSGVFIVLGITGLLKTELSGFASSEGVAFLSMTVNPLMSLIHLAAGLVGVPLALELGRARTYCLWVGAAGLVLGLLEFVVRDSSADILGRDTRMAVVHLILGAAGLAIWLWSRRPAAATAGASG